MTLILYVFFVGNFYLKVLDLIGFTNVECNLPSCICKLSIMNFLYLAPFSQWNLRNFIIFFNGVCRWTCKGWEDSSGSSVSFVVILLIFVTWRILKAVWNLRNGLHDWYQLNNQSSHIFKNVFLWNDSSCVWALSYLISCFDHE